MRSKFDSSDFVQSVWKSFFAHPDKLASFDRPEQFIAFLVTMARNKVGAEFRRTVLTEKRDVNREQPLYGDTAASNEPTGSQVAIARERWEQSLAGQPEHYRRVADLRLAGLNYEDIAERLGLHERTVRMIVGKLFRDDSPQ
jgi:RNA polymerase sigma factor (sigma-70 family)